MIFDLINNVPTVTIEGLSIPEFTAIWNSDKSKDKIKASQALAYIWHMADFNSNYAKLSEEAREAECKKDYILSEFTESEWKEVENAIEKYKLLQETDSMRLLKGARYAVSKFTEYFYGIDFTEVDSQGKPKYNSKDLASNLEKVGKIVSSLKELEEVVNKEMASVKTIRRGVKPSLIL